MKQKLLNMNGRGIRDRAILSVLLYTGARRSTICQTRIGHLFHEMGVHYVLLHEKGARQIRAPLHPEVSQRIQSWLEASGLSQSDPKGPLFRPFNKRRFFLIVKPIHDYVIWHIEKSTHAKQVYMLTDLILIHSL